MNDMMSVIYITQTGHVIGAVTCNSDPTRTLTPADVAGSDTAGPGFLLTAPMTVLPAAAASTLEEFFVPASVLSVSQPVKFNESVFQNPQGFAVSDGVIAASNAAVPAAWSLKLHPTVLEIDLTAAARLLVDTPVWAQIQDPPSSVSPQILVLAGTIPKSTAKVYLPLTVLPNSAPGSVVALKNYSVAVMVGGYGPIFANLKA